MLKRLETGQNRREIERQTPAASADIFIRAACQRLRRLNDGDEPGRRQHSRGGGRFNDVF